MRKIFVLGSINMDVVFGVDRLPNIGETIHSKDFFMSPGGKGANQAVACAKQGIKTIMFGSIGNDSLSKECKSSLMKYGVNCSYLNVVEDESCGVAGIIIENSDNRIIITPGANDHHNIDAITDSLMSKARKGDMLIAQLEIPLDVIKNTFKIAKSIGLTTILNAAPACDLNNIMYEFTDIISVNESEMKLLTSVNPTAKEEEVKAAEMLLNKGVNSVLLTLGKAGSSFISNNEYIHIDALPTKTVDTTSAGDTYIGVFATERLRGRTIKEAMKRSTIASMITVSRLGAQKSIPTNDEIDAFINNRKKA